MDKEFLESLGLAPEAVDSVLQAHEAGLEALRFTHRLEQEVTAAGGRNLKAITALLDVDALKEGGDAKEAVEGLKKECPYLFASAAAPYAPFTGSKPQEPEAPQTLAGALKERFGL